MGTQHFPEQPNNLGKIQRGKWIIRYELHIVFYTCLLLGRKCAANVFQYEYVCGEMVMNMFNFLQAGLTVSEIKCLLFVNAFLKSVSCRPPATRVNDKVMIPQDEYPEINFVGLLIGPR